MSPGIHYKWMLLYFPTKHFFKLFYCMCMDVSLECVSVHHMYAWPPQKLEEVIGSPGTRTPDGCKPLKVESFGRTSAHNCWTIALGPVCSDFGGWDLICSAGTSTMNPPLQFVIFNFYLYCFSYNKHTRSIRHFLKQTHFLLNKNFLTLTLFYFLG